MKTNYKGYQIRTFDEDDEWFYAIDDDGDTIASSYDQPGSWKREGKKSEDEAQSAAKTCLDRAISGGL